ncbi:MAG TPA: single-stranded DNA-binding protein, partial [Propionibacteriaceae bacterium]|nr:single-stranded DNA-binding protein [Propionibacteriaceae bacterium]
MDPRTTITGNAGGDAVFRVTPNGTQIAEFGLAHTRRILKDGLWQDGDTTWYNVKSFGRLADNVAASIRKGDGVVATGRLEID